MLAKKFAKELVKQGITIVSGMAIGIDSIAHKAVLEEHGNTIAVLPCGLENIYPEENKKLFQDIINNNGLVLSEYPPKKQATSKKFLERNRIVSGLSIGVLIVEAMHRSGTSVTARYAIEQKRKVFVPPHEIGDKNGVGTNKLLKQGAIIVTKTKDIIDNFKFLKYKDMEEIKLNCEKKSKNISQIDKKQTQKDSKILINNKIEVLKNKRKLQINSKETNDIHKIYELIENTAITIDEIQEKTNISISKINNCLFILEIEGYIKKVAGGGYICN